MTDITLRSTKGAPLTHDEVDANFSNLKETADAAFDAAGGLGGKANAAALGVDNSADDMGTFTGSTISDNATAKTALQELETAVESGAGSVATKANASALGVAASAADMGAFTGATIPDSQTAKQALQAVETAVETKSNATAIGIAATDANMGTTSGTVLSDNGTAKDWFGEAEAAIEGNAADLASTASGKGAAKVGWKLNATGSVARTVNDRLNDQGTAKDMGAVADGATSDTTALEAWLAAQPTAYSQAPLLKGTYVTTYAQAFQFAGRWDRSSPAIAKIGSRLLPFGDITADLTIYVGSGEVFTTLAQAIQYLKDRRIRGNFQVTIQVADGTYNSMSQIYWDHPDGAQVSILGNVTTPANVVLNFDATNNLSGFYIAGGCALKLINGFKIVGAGGRTGAGTWNANCYGAGINANGHVTLGGKLAFDSFYYGILAERGGRFEAPTSGITVTKAGDVAVHARYGGTGLITGATASVVSHTNGAVPLGQGFNADLGSTLEARNCEATTCQIAGFGAGVGGSLLAFGAYSHSNSLYGAVSFGGDIDLGYDNINNAETRLQSNLLGILVTGGGRVIMDHPSGDLGQITSNTYDGVSLTNCGMFKSTYLNIASNGGFGVKAESNGVARVLNTTFSSNTAGNTYADAATYSLVMTA